MQLSDSQRQILANQTLLTEPDDANETVFEQESQNQITPKDDHHNQSHQNNSSADKEEKSKILAALERSVVDPCHNKSGAELSLLFKQEQQKYKQKDEPQLSVNQNQNEEENLSSSAINVSKHQGSFTILANQLGNTFISELQKEAELNKILQKEKILKRKAEQLKKEKQRLKAERLEQFQCGIQVQTQTDIGVECDFDYRKSQAVHGKAVKNDNQRKAKKPNYKEKAKQTDRQRPKRGNPLEPYEPMSIQEQMWKIHGIHPYGFQPYGMPPPTGGFPYGMQSSGVHPYGMQPHEIGFEKLLPNQIPPFEVQQPPQRKPRNKIDEQLQSMKTFKKVPQSQEHVFKATKKETNNNNQIKMKVKEVPLKEQSKQEKNKKLDETNQIFKREQVVDPATIKKKVKEYQSEKLKRPRVSPIYYNFCWKKRAEIFLPYSSVVIITNEKISSVSSDAVLLPYDSPQLRPNSSHSSILNYFDQKVSYDLIKTLAESDRKKQVREGSLLKLEAKGMENFRSFYVVKMTLSVIQDFADRIFHESIYQAFSSLVQSKILNGSKSSKSCKSLTIVGGSFPGIDRKETPRKLLSCIMLCLMKLGSEFKNHPENKPDYIIVPVQREEEYERYLVEMRSLMYDFLKIHPEG